MDRDKPSNKLYGKWRDKWLKMFNRLTLGAARASNRVRRSWESYSRSVKTPIHIFGDPESRIGGMVIDLPRSKPIVYIWYISVQEWYLVPSKVLPKARKLRKVYRRYSVPSQDCYIAIVVERSTSGARRVASSVGIPIKTPDGVFSDMRKLFSKRFMGIIDSVRGKRIFGEFVFLVAMLQELAKEYVGDMGEILPLQYLERIAETGFTVPRDVGPPIGGLYGW